MSNDASGSLCYGFIWPEDENGKPLRFPWDIYCEEEWWVDLANQNNEFSNQEVLKYYPMPFKVVKSCILDYPILIIAIPEKEKLKWYACALLG